MERRDVTAGQSRGTGGPPSPAGRGRKAGGSRAERGRQGAEQAAPSSAPRLAEEPTEERELPATALPGGTGRGGAGPGRAATLLISVAAAGAGQGCGQHAGQRAASAGGEGP